MFVNKKLKNNILYANKLKKKMHARYDIMKI